MIPSEQQTDVRRWCESLVKIPGRYADENPWVVYFWERMEARGVQQRRAPTVDELDEGKEGRLIKVWRFIVRPEDREHFPELATGQVIEIAQSAKHGFLTEMKP